MTYVYPELICLGYKEIIYFFKKFIHWYLLWENLFNCSGILRKGFMRIVRHIS